MTLLYEIQSVLYQEDNTLNELHTKHLCSLHSYPDELQHVRISFSHYLQSASDFRLIITTEPDYHYFYFIFEQILDHLQTDHRITAYSQCSSFSIFLMHICCDSVQWKILKNPKNLHCILNAKSILQRMLQKPYKLHVDAFGPE